MKETEKQAFSKLLGDVMAFYRQDVSKFAMDVWWQACTDVDLETIGKALTQHAMDPERGQFAPKPADIVRLLQGTQQDRSLIAWGKVIDAIQRVGAYESVCFDDGVIHATLEDLGGWVKVCRGEMDELSYLQKRFTDSYKAYARRPGMTYPARLIGEHELSNKTHGFKYEQTALIGDPATAKNVLQNGANQPKTAITLLSDAVPSIKLVGGNGA